MNFLIFLLAHGMLNIESGGGMVKIMYIAYYKNDTLFQFFYLSGKINYFSKDAAEVKKREMRKI